MDRTALTNWLATFPSLKWKHAVVRGQDHQDVRWLPVLDLHGDGLFLGVSATGDWVAETRGGLVPLTPEGWLVPILVCLEHPRREITNQLTAGLEALGLPHQFSETFSFDELIAFGLTSSEYWANLTVGWLEEGPCKAAFLPALSLLANADPKRASQSLRHRALRLRRRIEQESSTSAADG